MANNRLWLYCPETRERVLIAKNFGTWGERVMGDLDGFLDDAMFNDRTIELRQEHDDYFAIPGIRELPDETTMRPDV